MLRRLICSLLFSALVLSGCGTMSAPTPTQTPNPPPASEGGWTIRMTQSGGIMGLSHSIEISSDGDYTVTDERSGKTNAGKLSDGELDRLARLVASTEYSPNPLPSGCADCFIYDIEISGAPRAFTARADDVTLASSGLSPLVTELRTIMDRELN